MMKYIPLLNCNQVYKYNITGFYNANLVISTQHVHCKSPQMNKMKHIEQKYAQFVTQSMEGVFAQTDSEHHLEDKCLVLQQIA